MNKIECVYNVYNNVLEMLQNRDYKITTSYHLTFKQFKKKYINNNYNFSLSHKVQAHRIYVIFSLNNKAKLQNIKQLLTETTELFSTEKDQVLIILNTKPNNIIIKYIEKSIYKESVELFWLSILRINITNHQLQPTFTLLTEKEKQELLQKYNIKIQNLPKMSIQDPICKYYKYPKHSIVKIIRKNKESISTEFYRYIS